jgi:HEAT repeat protein
MVILTMEISEEIKEAKDILQSLIKAKKTFRMYPANNPVYTKTLEETYLRFKEYFDYRDAYTITIAQHSISYESEQIYFNKEKEDNLALFFFKDGLREISFKKDLPPEELEEFLKVIALDFDREAIDDDVVTLLWEKDFENISYVVDESYLVDMDEENFASKAEEKAKEQITDVNDLMRAYRDGFNQEDVKTVSIVPLSDKDLQSLVKVIEGDPLDKIDKMILILFEILHLAEARQELENTFTSLKDIIAYAMKHGDVKEVLTVMKKAQEIIDNPERAEDEKRYMQLVQSYLGTDEVLSLLGEILDSGIEMEPVVMNELITFLDKSAIEPLIKILGELKTIYARRNVIEALVAIGRKDIKSIARGLHDQRWFVVRNIIYILRRIGDRSATESLLKIVRHGDIRVRKEAIKALGELGGQGIIQVLKESLNDPELQVRVVTAKALGSIGTDVAKKIILDKISEKAFKDKEFEEKREFFEVLSKWKDLEIYEFLIKVIKKKTFFRRSKNFENRASAAFCLGILGNRDALPILERFQNSKNKLLKEFSRTAIKRLQHE